MIIETRDELNYILRCTFHEPDTYFEYEGQNFIVFTGTQLITLFHAPVGEDCVPLISHKLSDDDDIKALVGEFRIKILNIVKEAK